jgi:hypothetical protein
MKAKLIIPFILLFFCQGIVAQDKPEITKVDRIRLAEAFKLGDSIGNRVWKDWTKAPFAVLLVTSEYEFLLRHPAPSRDFSRLGYDSLLKSDVHYRKRTQSTGLLATFPAISGSMISTIVVGQAEKTSAKTSTTWVVKLLHEHFHQLQNSQPNYYADVKALNLSRGDQTGMWMLNFPFPYDKPELQERFLALSELLARAIQTSQSDRAQTLTNYLRAREEFQQLLTPDEYRYFSFQLWQEGIARYTEYQVAKMAAARFRVSREFRALEDYTPFSQTATAIHANIFKRLRTQKLGESGREVVYPFGAAEGLLLDLVSPQWRRRYLTEKFDLGRYYSKRSNWRANQSSLDLPNGAPLLSSRGSNSPTTRAQSWR